MSEPAPGAAKAGLRRFARWRARPLSRGAKAAAAAAGAAAWTAVLWREGRVAERALGPERLGLRPKKSWLEVFKAAATDWSNDQISRYAASLSYFTLFSIAPLTLILVAVVGLFFGKETAQQLITGNLQHFLGPDKAKALHSMIVGAQKPGAGGVAGIIGFVTLLFGASSVVGELQSTLNEIFGVTPVAKSTWVTIKRRIISLGFVLGLGFLMLVTLAINTGAAAAGKYFGAHLGVPEAVIHLGNQVLTFGLITVLFVGMYRFLPDVRVAWRDLWIGGLFTAFLFAIGNLVLGLYLGKAGPTNAYGAAGSLLAFILWAYYCAMIMYFGAELTNSYAVNRGRGVVPVVKD